MLPKIDSMFHDHMLFFLNIPNDLEKIYNVYCTYSKFGYRKKTIE